MNHTEFMMEYLAVSFGKQFVIDECIEACAELIGTLQRLKSFPGDENQGIAQADLAHVVLWCGIVSMLLGKKEVSNSALDQLHEVYRAESRRRGATNV